MFRFAFLCLVLLLGGLSVFSQNNFTISGVVKDQKENLPGAAIYLSGYQISTMTNNGGRFTLPNLSAGSYDILVKMIGYFPFSKNIIISDKSVELEIILKENTTFLKEIVIKPDPNRAHQIELFKGLFLGKTPNAKDCKILNTEVLIVNNDPGTGMLTINATDFLVIENQALGYRIKYLLKAFEYDFKTDIYYYAGFPYYEELKGTNAQENKWRKKREIAYNGSQQHFFKALYTNRVADEGFIINKLIRTPNPSRIPDSIIRANIKKFQILHKAPVKTSEMQKIDDAVKTNPGTVKQTLTFLAQSDSLTYWYKQSNIPKSLINIDRHDVLVDTLVKVYDVGLKMMNYADELYVVYKKEVEDDYFKLSGHWQYRPKELKNYQVSVLQRLKPQFRFYANGTIPDSRNVLNKGFWAYEKMADAVPIDYQPILKAFQ
jgi:hypothetical protein